jgi:hypothetical protein
MSSASLQSMSTGARLGCPREDVEAARVHGGKAAHRGSRGADPVLGRRHGTMEAQCLSVSGGEAVLVGNFVKRGKGSRFFIRNKLK